MEETKQFTAPTKAEDFPAGETEIQHTYENGNKVVFLLLSNGDVAMVREGTGHDEEKAELEADGDKTQVIVSMMASCTKINGNDVASFMLSERKLKDYLKLKAAFATLNF